MHVLLYNALSTNTSNHSPSLCCASEPASNHLRATQGWRRSATDLQHWQEETRQVVSHEKKEEMDKISADRALHFIDQPFLFFCSTFKCIFCVVLCFYCFWKAGKANAFSAVTIVCVSSLFILTQWFYCWTQQFPFNSISMERPSFTSCTCYFPQSQSVELSSGNQHFLMEWPKKLQVLAES